MLERSVPVAVSSRFWQGWIYRTMYIPRALGDREACICPVSELADHGNSPRWLLADGSKYSGALYCDVVTYPIAWDALIETTAAPAIGPPPNSVVTLPRIPNSLRAPNDALSVCCWLEPAEIGLR